MEMVEIKLYFKKHIVDQENVQRSKIKKKGEMTGCQVGSK
jgi:hypothetical protein